MSTHRQAVNVSLACSAPKSWCLRTTARAMLHALSASMGSARWIGCRIRPRIRASSLRQCTLGHMDSALQQHTAPLRARQSPSKICCPLSKNKMLPKTRTSPLPGAWTKRGGGGGGHGTTSNSYEEAYLLTAALVAVLSGRPEPPLDSSWDCGWGSQCGGVCLG